MENQSQQPRLPETPLSPMLAIGAIAGTMKSGLSSYLDLPFLLITFAVLALVGAFEFWRNRDVTLPQGAFDGYKITEPIQSHFPWFRVFAPLLALVIGDIGLDSAQLDLPTELLVGTKFIAITGAITYSGWHASRAIFYEGPRRARLIAASGLDGITSAGQDCMEKYRWLGTTLVRVGGIDGCRVQARALAQVSGREVGEVLDSASELEKAGLARIATLMSPDEPDKWFIELTEDGVKAWAARTR